METKYNFVLAVSRQFGTRGLSIARAAAERMGMKILDRSYLGLLCEKFNLTEEEIEAIKARKTNWWDEVCHFYTSNVALAARHSDEHPQKAVTPRALYHAETRVMKDYAEHEPCVIVGRSACHIFKDEPYAMKVFIHGSEEKRIQNTMEKQGVGESEARKMVREIDKSRDNYAETFSGKTRYDLRDYDLVVSIDKFSFDEAVDIIVNAAQHFIKLHVK